MDNNLTNNSVPAFLEGLWRLSKNWALFISSLSCSVQVCTITELLISALYQTNGICSIIWIVFMPTSEYFSHSGPGFVKWQRLQSDVIRTLLKQESTVCIRRGGNAPVYSVMPLSYPMFVNMWWIQEPACYMSCRPVPSVCFSLTFQSQARPLSSLTPLATFSLLSILHSSFFPTHSHEWYSPRERKEECKNSRERQRREGWAAMH